MNTEWSMTTKYITGVGLILFGLFLLYITRTILPLLIIAALIAFLLTPIINFLHKQIRFPRILAVLFSYLLFVAILLLIPLLFVPIFADGINELATIQYQVLFNTGVVRMTEFLQDLGSSETEILGRSIDLSPITAPLLATLQTTEAAPLQLPSIQTLINWISSAAPPTLAFASDVAGAILTGSLVIILILFFSIYMSLEASRLWRAMLRLVPEPHRPEFIILTQRLKKIWNAYVQGQFQLMFIIGTVTWVVGNAIGLPNTLTLAIIAGILELVPNIGPFLAVVPAIIIALILGSTYLPVSNFVFALIVLGCYFAIQQVEYIFLVPRIMGDAVELPKLIVLIGIVVGATIGGILGILLAAPIIASCREIIRYTYAKILNEDPFPIENVADQLPKEPTWTEKVMIYLTKLFHQMMENRARHRQ